MLAFGLGRCPTCCLQACPETFAGLYCSKTIRLAAGLVVLGFGVFGLVNAPSLGANLWNGVVCATSEPTGPECASALWGRLRNPSSRRVENPGMAPAIRCARSNSPGWQAHRVSIELTDSSFHFFEPCLRHCTGLDAIIDLVETQQLRDLIERKSECLCPADESQADQIGAFIDAKCALARSVIA